MVLACEQRHCQLLYVLSILSVFSSKLSFFHQSPQPLPSSTDHFFADMTAFDCSVSGSPADATPIAAPQDPLFCQYNPDECVSGSKRPLYAYDSPSNVPWFDNNHRPGYHASWSFPNNGAQNDIFEPVGYIANASATSTAASTTSTAASSAPTGAGGAVDIALSVKKATASSTNSGQSPYSAIDGYALGYTDALSWEYVFEWATYYGGAGSWINLEWASAVTFNQLVIYVRPLPLFLLSRSS
jgi:hypothetical protein